MRVGWMRPSAISFISDSRATSRRTGSKDESTTASGVSSMIRSTPVACSRARMLRPSLPMIRPFISSLGMVTDDCVVSTVVSAAQRWMAWETIQRARPGGLLLGLDLDLPHPGGGLALRLRLDRGHHLRAGLVAGQAGDALELPALRLLQLLGLGAHRLQLVLLLGQLPVALLQAFALALELLLALRQALLPALHLGPPLAGRPARPRS